MTITSNKPSPLLGRLGWLAVIAFIAACGLHWLHFQRMQNTVRELQQKIRVQEYAQAFAEFQANYILWKSAQKRPGDFERMISHINTQTAASGQNLFETMMRITDPTDQSSISFARSTLEPVFEFLNAGWSPDEAKRMRKELSALQK